MNALTTGNSLATLVIIGVLTVGALYYIGGSFRPSRMRHDSGRGSLVLLAVMLAILFLGWLLRRLT